MNTVAENNNIQISNEKGSVLLFCVIILSVITITFSILLATSTSRVMSTKMNADITEYQNLVESIGNAYIAEISLSIDIAEKAVAYYMSAEYYKKDTPAQFSTELYAEENSYNEILRYAVSQSIQDDIKAHYQSLSNPDKSVLLGSMEVKMDQLYTDIVYDLLGESPSLSNPDAYNKALMLQRLETTRASQNQLGIDLYGVDASQEMLTSSVVIDLPSTYEIPVSFSNYIDASSSVESFKGIARFEHKIDIGVSTIPNGVLSVSPENSAMIDYKIADSARIVSIKKWQVIPLR